MKTFKAHENISGIYCIRNIINDKKYIGKSKNIRQRIYSHIGGLNSKNTKRENQHFINAWWKYNKVNFEYFILEIIDIKIENFENILKEKELFWMNYYKTTNRNFGYNLRQDSSTNLIILDETRKKLSNSRNKRKLKFPNLDKENGIKISNFWKNNPDVKEKMKKKLSDIHTKYLIYQYSKDGKTLIKIWNKVKDVISENPTYKTHNIYSVCSGAKPTIYGYKWIKKLKDDIVQPDGNILENDTRIVSKFIN
jgi:group I intron endonuclease